MKIQIINYSEEKEDNSIIYSKFAMPKSLDEFDVNIIDLTNEKMWYCDQQSFQAINCIDDFRSISIMIANAQNTKILFVLPQDTNIYLYTGTVHINNFGRQEKNYKCLRLKDHLATAEKFIYSAFINSYSPFESYYENTETIIGELAYKAAFYFKNKNETLSYSKKSNKTTTIKYNDSIYLTTLDIFCTQSHLLNFIKTFFEQHNRQEAPIWMNDINFFDDSAQKDTIRQNEEIIENANQTIAEANQRLDNNNKIKSILYTTGAELVDVVLKILEEILNYSFADFVDKKQEDFLVKKDTYTLIGEIKGINSNVRNENVSQLENHFQIYQDNLQEKGISENVHQILIINPFRMTPLNERTPINENQINPAVRNGSLIIETKTLLRLYELFLGGRIKVSDCEKLFLEKTGLLSDDDFKDF